jgi:hypothetical protein
MYIFVLLYGGGWNIYREPSPSTTPSHLKYFNYTHDNINKLEMVQRRAARYVQNNYHNTSSVTSMIDTLGWPTLAERRYLYISF